MNPHFDVMGMEVFEVHGDFEAYMPLMLDADPSRELVEKYLMKGKLWACADARARLRRNARGHRLRISQLAKLL